MSAPTYPDLLRVPAGISAGAAARDAGLPGRGEPGAIVVVRDAEGKLRDLSKLLNFSAKALVMLAEAA